MDSALARLANAAGLIMTTSNRQTAPIAQAVPIAIVGGGPVGLLLALFLDRYGVRSVLFNTDAEVRPHPKGSTHNARTMEHHRRLGFATAIRALGLPPERPTDVRYFTRLNGWELARIPMPSEGEKLRAVATSAATDQVPEPLLRANQLYVEQFLLERAREARNITVRFGWHVDRFEDDDDGATIHAEATENGAREVWRAQYLVGCDGGRSSVRRALALRYHGLGKLDVPHFGGRMVATHMRAPTLYRDHLARHHGWQYWMINPDMRATIITLAGDEEFLVFSKATDDNAPPPDAEISAKLQQGVGAAFAHKMLDHRLWTAGVALVAERFVAGRVILAGDAAHLFTPTGGFGMNTGMDDASNLAWKLAATVQGWGGAGLIQTYETERKPVAERNTNAARALNKNLTNYTVAPAIEHDTAEGAAARHMLGAHLASLGEQYASIGVQLGARYDGSPTVAGDEAPPPDPLDRYIPSGIPGGRAPHYWLGEGRGVGDSLYDRFGLGFTLLRLGGKAADGGAIEAAAKRHGLPLKVIDLPNDEARELYGRDLVLIRPDQYVAWRGNGPPADPDRLINRIAGAA
jgi:2-polyprenyl-6-methoxyphenol hydroxylase-like FAD-dependent oxidoreductase